MERTFLGRGRFLFPKKGAAQSKSKALKEAGAFVVNASRILGKWPKRACGKGDHKE
jgi:hypothetical protein